jgi:hypothetical protein
MVTDRRLAAFVGAGLVTGLLFLSSAAPAAAGACETRCNEQRQREEDICDALYGPSYPETSQDNTACILQTFEAYLDCLQGCERTGRGIIRN